MDTLKNELISTIRTSKILNDSNKKEQYIERILLINDEDTLLELRWFLWKEKNMIMDYVKHVINSDASKTLFYLCTWEIRKWEKSFRNQMEQEDDDNEDSVDIDSAYD